MVLRVSSGSGGFDSEHGTLVLRKAWFDVALISGTELEDFEQQEITELQSHHNTIHVDKMTASSSNPYFPLRGIANTACHW